MARRLQLRLEQAGGDETSWSARWRDALLGLTVQLRITATEAGVFESAVSVFNAGQSTFAVDYLAALHLNVSGSFGEWLRCTGFWANEFQASREPIGASTLVAESLRGRSHASSPSIVLGESGFSEQCGRVVSAALCWSGDHRIEVSRARDGRLQLRLGVPLRPGDLQLAPGESFDAPMALFLHSAEGLNGIRRQTQRFWRGQRERTQAVAGSPVHFNSWEARYFDHDEHSTRALIAEAAALGAERFILDDGWMAGRTGPGFGLGDWLPCPQRYPRGLRPLAECARSHGLEFGLWIEPEMVTGDAQVARLHPDWVVGAPQTPAVYGRGQRLLNLCLPAVRQYILEVIDRLVRECEPACFKWDMNRDYAQTGSASRGISLSLHLGFRRLLAEVRRRYPAIVIEICASGGARADAGAVESAGRIWPSDSMDPLQRFGVHRMASLWIPMHMLGSHVGGRVCATSSRAFPLATRCALALQGHPGLELDPVDLSPDDRRVLAFWLQFYKQRRDWLQHAQRLFIDQCPHGLEAMLAWDDEGGRGLLWVLRSGYPAAPVPWAIRLPLPADSRRYRIRLINPEDCAFVAARSSFHAGKEAEASGEWLRQIGLQLPNLQVDHCAVVEIDPQ
jgi:alpha-galactosidase